MYMHTYYYIYTHIGDDSCPPDSASESSVLSSRLARMADKKSSGSKEASGSAAVPHERVGRGGREGHRAQQMDADRRTGQTDGPRRTDAVQSC